ncbi:CRISPR-associated protein Cas_Cmr3 [Enhygromyxa salina]|uniref:CRISPR-associated protein Cas_Cmr3 n=1 Tax=Enhygromyxa salina TaxID=215803 RepID=A0A2S9XEX6_9BACT|nr:type III-B CRISPR module-associated Cmr3 family protein [Enhygromyxa salina]PRP91419.1 CRISPR-associated protein Cas_Cmr3 [Enhygromyxa salina]
MKHGDFVLTPRDGLFCKDGRGWFTSSMGRGHALEWPYPSTLLGALRSTWGRAREEHKGAPFVGHEWPRRTADLSLGPSLPLRRSWGDAWSSKHRVWPAPTDSRVVEGGIIQRLEARPPLVTTMGINNDPARERLWTAPSTREKSVQAAKWWREQAFVAWLCGAHEGASTDGLELPRRIQTHVAIDEDTGSALDRNLYSHDIVETFSRSEQWGIGVRVSANDLDHVDIATVGSDRRLAAVEPGASVFDMPKALLEAFKPGVPGLRLFLVTPAAFTAGWLPDGLTAHGDEYRGRLRGLEVDVVLRAAFVDRPRAISGWDMAERKPKACTRAVSPGSVYAFTRLDGELFSSDHARALWLAAIGQRRDEGFGVVVPGTWTPSLSQRS